jgi:ABC-type antimicrobial peptide transport system permease subunit
MRFGVTVPLATARRILRDYASDPTESYASILLKADTAASVPEITDAVKNAGLSVDETAERTGNILGAATGLASLVGLLVLALAALNIAHSFFASLSERRRELAIMRATGARRTDLVGIVLTQAVMLGLAGAVVGGLAAVLVAWLIDWAARVFLPSFPFKPESFFAMPASLFAWAALAAVVASVLGALWPAVRAARTQVARALAEA